MSDHARFSPSKLSRIMACPGSLKLSETLPEPPESVYAAEGTLLHEYTRDVLAIDFDTNIPAQDKHVTAYWQRVNASVEHMALVQDTIDALFTENILSEWEGASIIQDIRVHINEECNGTLDLAVETDTRIHIIDFKFGAGVSVDPDDNPQLMAYTIGYLKKYYPVSNTSIDKEIWNWIFQPRLDKFVGVRVYLEDLDYFEGRLEKAILLANGHYPPIRPGASQCRWCPAGAVCKERMQRVQEDAATIFSAFADLQDISKVDDSYTPCGVAELSRILQMEDQIDSALKAIREHLFNVAMRGEEVPGYKIVTGRGSRSWNPGVDLDAIQNTFPQLDTEDMLKVELLSPAAMEKLLPSKERKKLEQFYSKFEGKPTLAVVTSAKQAIDVTAQSQFAAFADAEELK